MQHCPPTENEHDDVPVWRQWPARLAAKPFVQVVQAPFAQLVQLGSIDEQAWQLEPPFAIPKPGAQEAHRPLAQD
jgi:hypothetical protein